MSGEKSCIFYLSPHKSLDKIFKEYGVEDKVNPNVVEEWADVAGKVWLQSGGIERKAVERLAEEAVKLGKSLGVTEERLPAFVKDIVRTTLFYLQAAEIIGDVVEEIEKKEDNNTELEHHLGREK